MDFQYLENNSMLKEGVTSMQDELYILEDSNCCIRCCLQDGRPLTLNVSQGGEAGGAPVVKYTKPLGCPAMFTVHTDNGDADCPCCCFLPQIDTVLPDGRTTSNSR